MKVLLVEDSIRELELQRAAVEGLLPDGSVVSARGPRDAVRQIRDHDYDIALIRLSSGADLEQAEEMISLLLARGQPAVVCVSPHGNATNSEVDGSADANLLFPRMVRAFIREALCVTSGNSPLSWDPFSIEQPKWRSREVHLSPSEQRLLLALTKVPNRLVPKEELYDAFERWGREPRRLRMSLTTCVYHLRKAFLAIDPEFDRIRSSGSDGYFWRDP